MNDMTPYRENNIDRARQADIAERLCKRTPAENLQHMEEVSKGFGVGMVIDREPRFSKDGKMYRVVRGARFDPAATNENRRKVRDAFHKMLMPAPRNTIIRWLSELRLKAIRKGTGKVDEAAEYAAYAEELEGYPADVVQYALQAKNFEWWPPVGAILKICDEQVEDRVAVIRKLEGLIVKHDRKQQEDDIQPDSFDETVTKKDRWFSLDDILKQNGFTPKTEWHPDWDDNGNPKS